MVQFLATPNACKRSVDLHRGEMGRGTEFVVNDGALLQQSMPSRAVYRSSATRTAAELVSLPAR